MRILTAADLMRINEQRKASIRQGNGCMTDATTLRRKGGRPPLPPPPQNTGDCRGLIAAEIVKTIPKEGRLRRLYRLLRAFERAEIQAAAELKNRLLDEANRLKTAELELKRAEYQRRYALGQQTKALKQDGG